MKPLRIGEINYTNVWPVFHHFRKEQWGHDVKVIRQVPTQLNKAMSEGTVDLGPISSFAYAEAGGDYALLPNLSVSADGPVRSILLFHRKPLEELRNATFALPNTSATSVHLLKVIMEKFYEGAPRYFYAAPRLSDMMERADAALLIGDDAIKAQWRATHYHVTDLGTLWKHWTGHWMTFAVWAIRRDAIERHPRLSDEVAKAFLESKQRGLHHLDEVISRAVQDIGGPPSYWHQYFTNLNHDFGPEQQAGLKLYYRLVHDLGFINNEVHLDLYTDKSMDK